MAQTLTKLQAQLDSLKTARNSGVLRVGHGDNLVYFRTLDEMSRTIALLEKDIAALAGTLKRSRVNYIEQRHRGYTGRRDIRYGRD